MAEPAAEDIPIPEVIVRNRIIAGLEGRPWYHGSPFLLSVLNKGSMVTPFVEIAKAFSHKPKLLSMSDNMRSVRHNGELPGLLYMVSEQVDVDDLVELQGTKQTHWEIRRDLRVDLVYEVPVDDPPLLTGDALRRSQEAHSNLGIGFHEQSDDD